MSSLFHRISSTDCAAAIPLVIAQTTVNNINRELIENNSLNNLLSFILLNYSLRLGFGYHSQYQRTISTATRTLLLSIVKMRVIRMRKHYLLLNE